MSHAKDIAQNSTAICIAVLGLGTGTGAIAIGAAGLAAIGYQLFDAHRATCESAVKQVMKDIEKSGTESDATLQAARDLLADSRDEVTVNRIDLPEAARQEDFYSAVVDYLMESFPKEADYNALRLVRLAMGHAFQACRYEDVFHRPLEQKFLVTIQRGTSELLEGQKRADEERAVLHTKMDANNDLLNRLMQQIESDPKHREEIERRGKLVLRLAERYAEGNPDNFDDALTGLERALEVAAKERARDGLPGNVSDAVDAIVARVDELNDQGRIDEASVTLMDEIDRQEAAQARLLDKGLAQAVLTRDVALAVRLELKKLALDGGGFEAVRAVQNKWYERGRDKGLRFELEVAIALAQENVTKARKADQPGTALNDLGIALLTLGKRESETGRLYESIATHTKALKTCEIGKEPHDWAMTQNNLGTALLALGERENNTERLHEAVSAYEQALEVWKRKRARLQWGAVQMNLGNAHAAIGQLDNGTERLQLAVSKYKKALKERTQEKTPQQWAKTQSKLAKALTTIGERESGTDRLHEAVAAYREALKEFTREKVPLDWAMTQMNLGTAQQTLGERESGTKWLHEAITAYREALKEYTREKVPLQWAMVQMNLGNALTVLGKREKGTKRLDQAVTAYTEALKERTRKRVPMQWAMVQGNLCELELAFLDKTNDAAHLSRAQGYLDAAREVFAEAGASHYLQIIDNLQREIDAQRDG